MNTAAVALGVSNLGLPPDVEQRAGAVLQARGWSVADALRFLLVRIADEGRIPFDDAVAQAAGCCDEEPNAPTQKVLEDLDAGVGQVFDTQEAFFEHLGI